MFNGLSHQAAVLSLVKNKEIKGRKEKKNRKAVELEKLEVFLYLNTLIINA